MNADFTIVYTFAARTAFMEMNFPHKELVQIDRNDTIDSADLADTMLAHAIARQSLSFSAQSFMAHKNGAAATMSSTSAEWMEDRIQFFAEGRPKGAAGVKARTFLRGHFRPDLASGCLREYFDSENEQGKMT